MPQQIRRAQHIPEDDREVVFGPAGDEALAVDAGLAGLLGAQQVECEVTLLIAAVGVIAGGVDIDLAGVTGVGVTLGWRAGVFDVLEQLWLIVFGCGSLGALIEEIRDDCTCALRRTT